MEILSAFIFGKKRLPKDWLKIELTWGEAWVMRNLFRGVTPEGSDDQDGLGDARRQGDSKDCGSRWQSSAARFIAAAL